MKTEVPEILVAAAAICSGDQVLLTQRAPDSHQGGLWEFPGGKIEPGETIAQALTRELTEELAIQPLRSQPLIRLAHQYDDRRVVLVVHEVSEFAGTPTSMEGQPAAWVSRSELQNWPMPAADLPIVRALQLPRRYVISGGEAADFTGFIQQLRQVLLRGERLIQLRAPGLSPDDYSALAERCIPLCRRAGARLLLNADPETARRLDADGVHLNSRHLAQLYGRPLPSDRLVAASCHSPAELTRAMETGCDFALLSPVLATASHPDAEPLGWQTFSDWVGNLPLPIYALGGMRPELLDQAIESGAQGIAAIRGLWD